MAIEPNIIAARTVKRDAVAGGTPPPVALNLDPVTPGVVFFSPGDNSWKVRAPQYPGEVIAVHDGTSATCELYVYFDSLWRRCKPSSTTIDPRTGRPYDPLAEFYNPLAT